MTTTTTTTTTTVSVQLDCVKSKYAQCGGAGFVGDTCCPGGMWCMRTDTYWSQCEPCLETWDAACSETGPTQQPETSMTTTRTMTTTMTTTATTTTVSVQLDCVKSKYAQCGGTGFIGDTCCPGDMWCMRTDPYWSQCEPCLETWDAACSATPKPKPEPQGGCEDGWTAASWTWYISYAACCKDNPNYDPNASTEECDLYSACDYSGAFAYAAQRKPFEWVKSHNIVAFFSGHGDNAEYGNKHIRIKAKGTSLEATVLDTCGDHDCGGCCSRNAQPSGYLVDMEYWTVVRNFGELAAADGQLCWQLADVSQASNPQV